MLSIMNMLPTNVEASTQSNTCVRPPKIHIVIVFGKPKYDCEVYPGICVFLYGTFDKSNPLSAGTMTSYENGELQIEIQKSEISDELNKKLKENSVFELEDEVSIPDQISNDLGSDHPITLIAGNYFIKEESNAFVLTIGCH